MGSDGQRCGEVGWGGVGWGGVGVCVCVCVCVAKPVAVELRCHATALIDLCHIFPCVFFYVDGYRICIKMYAF